MFNMRTIIFVAGLIAAAYTVSLPAQAQLVAASDEPVDITGDTAEFQDNIAIWTGNVRVLQGEAILTAKKLEATLNDDGNFEKIKAIGSVRYSNGKEAITGDFATYNATDRTITLTDNVILTQGKQVMAAGSVTYWVETGRVKFNPERGKRIRGIFYTEQNNPNGSGAL